MRPTLLKHLLIVLLALSTVTACKKDDFPVKDADSYGNISYFAKASGSGVERRENKSDGTMNTVAVEWSSASIYVEKIAFVGKSDNLLDTVIFVEKNIDIFNADALAGIIKLPTGSYKDVKVKLFCLKSKNSDLAFDLKGTFRNTKGGIDHVRVGSSFPFEADLTVTDITINPSDEYKATFTFNLDKVMTGISTELLQTARSFNQPDNSLLYVIWKGGSDEEPFYDQVVENWQTVASVVVTKQ
ncbi:hypothetical protein [uncultured Pontibacter sp.]|uniref:hypothetical protein n=1 Tax=uncultured Pontibacter sp. TaxID=453356 RepID=UPI0026137691|nr:hypothetical protein [uncultured Pontibacter sp.]